MTRHEDPLNAIEQHKQSDGKNVQPFHAADLQVGVVDMARMIARTPIDDGFSINFTDGKTSGQAGDNMKHTADGKPAAPIAPEDHMKHMTEASTPGDEDRIGSRAWIHKHSGPGAHSEDPMKPFLPANSPDKGGIFDPDSQAYRDNIRKVLIDNPYGAPMVSPEASAADAAALAHKEHFNLPNKFVHKWNPSPADSLLNSPVDIKPVPIGAHQPNEDLTGGKTKSHSWF